MKTNRLSLEGVQAAVFVFRRKPSNDKKYDAAKGACVCFIGKTQTPPALIIEVLAFEGIPVAAEDNESDFFLSFKSDCRGEGAQACFTNIFLVD